MEPFRCRTRLRGIMVVGRVMATKPIISRGHESGGPQKDTETRVLALRGAAGAKPLQCWKQ